MIAAPAVPRLAVENINTYYGDSHILRDVSLHIGAGETVALLGRNGVGKTTAGCRRAAAASSSTASNSPAAT